MNDRSCGSLFSGIGLLDYGLHLAGWEHKWLCESDEWRRGVLRKRFPGAVVFDDVRTLRCEAAADADEQRGGVGSRRARGGLSSGRRGPDAPGFAQRVGLIAGGFPCKGASTAGKREGFGHAETVLCDGDAKLRRVRARVDRSRLSALGDGVHVYVGWLVGEYIASLERERVAA